MRLRACRFRTLREGHFVAAVEVCGLGPSYVCAKCVLWCSQALVYYAPCFAGCPSVVTSFATVQIQTKTKDDLCADQHASRYHGIFDSAWWSTTFCDQLNLTLRSGALSFSHSSLQACDLVKSHALFAQRLFVLSTPCLSWFQSVKTRSPAVLIWFWKLQWIVASANSDHCWTARWNFWHSMRVQHSNFVCSQSISRLTQY